MKKRALISVSDKSGIDTLARKISALGYEIISTGGTYKLLQSQGIDVINISEVTGFPECLDGRVKTLHPIVHAGILAMRSNPSHMEQLAQLNINTIDMVVVNLYPFKQTILKDGVEFGEVVENIDIGGPTMLRSAAKNYQDVIVMVDPKDYDIVLTKLENGSVDIETRKYLMYKVYQHTAVYDTMIANYMQKKLGIEYPDQLTLAFEKKDTMRYGENPHQSAAFYGDELSNKYSLTEAQQLNGKALSFNNINDTNAAMNLCREFNEPTIVALKHTNPCGVASDKDIFNAYLKAYASDPVSIFGGIIASNREIDAKTATEMAKIFLEVIIAPDFTDEALEILKKKSNLRLLKLPSMAESYVAKHDIKRVTGGMLYQSGDDKVIDQFKTVTASEPTEAQKADMIFGMKIVKHCKSNAIVLVKDNVSQGIGVGQTNRIWAAKQAIEHCINGAQGTIMCSDAFFPFSDCVEVAAENNIAAIVQPGGSIRDQESIDACNKYKIPMSFTGLRHFKH